MRRLIVGYLGALVVFLGLDAVWLTLTSAPLYRPALGAILAGQPRLVPAVLFYLIYLIGVIVFAVAPALEARRWTSAAARGALFGFFAYATYDLTNQATMAVWATRVTILDMAWGSVVTAAGATAGYLAASRVTPRQDAKV